MNNSKQVKLFDANNDLVNNFDDEIDKILTSVHGSDYYDKDEPYVDTRLIPLNEIKKRQEAEKNSNIDKHEKKEDTKKVEDIKIVKVEDHKTSLKDFIPLILFVIVFIGFVIGGYYFLNHFDFGQFLNL